MTILENILTPEEVEKLSGQDRSPELTEFKHFSGIDGTLYFGRGITLSPKDYQVVGAMSFAAPANTDKKILAMAVEDRRIRGSNACVLKYELGIDQRFSLLTKYDQGVNRSNFLSIFSVVYIKADEKKLKELEN